MRSGNCLPGPPCFFLEDLSYRFLILYVSEREFVIEFWRSVVRGSCARTRARVLPISAPNQQLCRDSAPGCPGSTILVVREHDLALPDRSCPRSTIQVVREHGAGCPGAPFRFFLEDLSYRFLTRSVSKRDFVLHFGARLSRVPAGARARACSRSVLPISNYAGILLEVVLGARFWLSGSTT